VNCPTEFTLSPFPRFKLLDEERILVKRVPRDHPDFEHIQAAVRHLAKLTSVYPFTSRGRQAYRGTSNPEQAGVGVSP
jgi:hypothetical protein